MSTSGALPYGATLVVCGAAALGVGASAFFRSGQLSVMARLWTLGGASSSPMAVTLLQVGTIMGAVVVGCGLLAAQGHLVKQRAMVAVAMTVAVAAAGVQVFSAVQWSALIANSQGDLLLLTETAYNFAYSAEQRALLDTSLAVFNKCCYDRYVNDTKIPAVFKKDVQSAILPCPAAKGLDPFALPVCAPLPDVVLKNPLISAENRGLLCACYTASSYDPVYAALDTATCDALGAISVPVGESLKIPVINLPVHTILKTTQFSAYLPVQDIAMTGMPAPRDPASVNGDGVTPTPPTDKNAKEGFNCGLGYAKGVTFTQGLVIAQTAPGASTVFFVAAGVQVLATALLTAFWVMSGSQKGDEWLETHDPNKAQVAP
jgi:hypothetical protein